MNFYAGCGKTVVLRKIYCFSFKICLYCLSIIFVYRNEEKQWMENCKKNYFFISFPSIQ